MSKFIKIKTLWNNVHTKELIEEERIINIEYIVEAFARDSDTITLVMAESGRGAFYSVNSDLDSFYKLLKSPNKEQP